MSVLCRRSLAGGEMKQERDPDDLCQRHSVGHRKDRRQIGFSIWNDTRVLVLDAMKAKQEGNDKHCSGALMVREKLEQKSDLNSKPN
jgi:hypothetical protein